MFVIQNLCKSDNIWQLFPTWKGGFEGSRPSLTGLRNDQVRGVLETGIMTDGELKALLHLVQSPDVRCFCSACYVAHRGFLIVAFLESSLSSLPFPHQHPIQVPRGR
jgi:hypothetical protein